MRPLHPALFGFAVVCLLAPAASAVVIAGGDGSQNTTAPADDFGFANVGSVFDGADGIFTSGVYLGNGWVITAYHAVRDNAGGFQLGSAVFGGQAYSFDSASAHRLLNPSDNSPTDLALIRLTLQPDLPALALSSSSPPKNASVILSGNGFTQAPSLTYWNTATNPWTETTSQLGNASGYEWGPYGQTIHWGTNQLGVWSANSTTSVVSEPYGAFTAIKTDFTKPSSGGTAFEAQAVGGDSGGGVFYKKGSSWELAGILLLTGGYPNQPDATAVYGNETYAADLPTYRSQIQAIIPEPGSAALLGLGALILSRRRRGQTAAGDGDFA